jgi:hypothetical protein
LTEDEARQLKDAVQMHGGKDWVAIAALVLDRTKAQCCGRWHDGLDPRIDRTNGRAGKWAEDEEIKLNWGAIAALVLVRTERQCCMRWMKNQDTNRSTLREEEDVILNKAPALGQDRRSS